MERWVQRLLLMPIVVMSLVAIIAAVGVLGGVGPGQARGDGGIEDHERFGLDYVPVSGEEGGMAVRSVVIRLDGKNYVADARRGVETVNQNRISLGWVPLVGGLTDPPLSWSDFGEDRWLAEAMAGDERLLVDLPSGMDLPQRVVLVNRDYAFVLRDAPSESRESLAMTGKPFGQAYRHSAGQTLLILVKPSVVTDRHLF